MHSCSTELRTNLYQCFCALQSGLIPAGKWFKGMYRSKEEIEAAAPAQQRQEQSVIAAATGLRPEALSKAGKEHKGGQVVRPIHQHGKEKKPSVEPNSVLRAVGVESKTEKQRLGVTASPKKGEATPDQAA